MSFKINFQDVNPHAGDKWLTHGIKHCKGIFLDSLELPCEMS